jgi:NAD(P)-dependent dehydrogenase (short-subunit alcohol dehydrogenase family)
MKRELPDQLRFLQNRKAVQKHSEESMQGKLCVVSGSTSGVGYETVKRLASGGANIVMVCRNKEKAIKIKTEIEQKHSVTVDYVLADFADLNQVRQAAEQIKKKYPRIDVLINSAGVHSTTKNFNQAGIEMVFCVNHLANFLLTYSLLDNLIASPPARIIQVNSEGHRFSDVNLEDLEWKKHHYTGLKSYGASKTAQLYTVWELAKKLANTGVTINAVHPGEVKTNIGNNNGKLYRWFLHHVTWHFLKDPVISGEALYYLASAKEMESITGKFFNLTIEEKPAKHALDSEKQKQVWAISMNMTGLKDKEF